jgi:hypothetical protein
MLNYLHIVLSIPIKDMVIVNNRCYNSFFVNISLE